MIKLTNKKKIKGDLLFLGGGSGPQPGSDVAWLTPTMLAILGVENGKPYHINDAGYVEMYFLCKMEHIPTIGIKMDGVEAANIGSDVLIPIDESIIQALIEEGFPEEVINEFRTYIGYFFMLGYGEVPPLTTGTHSITLKVDNLVYTDIIEYSNTFYYVSYFVGSTSSRTNTPAISTGAYYTYIQRITVVDPPKLGVLAPDGNYYFMVMSNGNEYYVKVPQPLDVDDEISVDGVTINGYFNPDYKLPHIPTSVANYLYPIDIYNAHPTSQDWGETECQWDNSHDIYGYYQLDGVGVFGSPGVDTLIELPSFNYNALSDWEIEVEFYQIPTTTSYIFYGSKSGTSKVYLRCSNTGNLSVGWYSNSFVVGDIVPNRVYNIKKVGQRIYFDNVAVGGTLTSTSYTVLNNLKLFDSSSLTPYKVKSFKWLNNGNLTHNLVPGIYAQLHTIDTDYGHAAFYDTVAGDWIGTDKFLTQGNIDQPICLPYSAGSDTKIITNLKGKLCSSWIYEYTNVIHSSAASDFTYTYPNQARVRQSVVYVGWDEIITHSVLQDDGTILYNPKTPLAISSLRYSEAGRSITGLNRVTGSSRLDVVNQIQTGVFDYPTGCTYLDPTDGVMKILIGKLNTSNQTLQGYREYVRDNYATTGVYITYIINPILTYYIDIHNPLWRTTEGDEISWSYDPVPQSTQITEIEL